MQQQHFVYISASKLASKDANAVHVAKMCQAFSKIFNVTLLADISEIQTKQEIFNKFNISHLFEIKHIKRIKIPIVWNIIYTLQIYNFLKKRKQNHVIYGRYVYGVLISLFTSKNSVIIYEAHSLPQNRIQAYAEAYLYKHKNFTNLVTISNQLKQDYLKTFPFLKEGDVIVAHDGADVIENSPPVKTFTKDKTKRFNIGYVGKLTTGKGMDLLIKIAALCPCDTFHIIGGNDTEVAAWQEKVESNNIRFHGYQPHSNVSTYIQAMDIMLAPLQPVNIINKKYDIGRWTSPLKIFEYMSAKKTMIISDLPVLREIINHQQNGLLAAHNDANAWKNALNELHNNPALEQKLAFNALETLKQKYTWDIRSKNIIKAISCKKIF